MIYYSALGAAVSLSTRDLLRIHMGFESYNEAYERTVEQNELIKSVSLIKSMLPFRWEMLHLT